MVVNVYRVGIILIDLKKDKILFSRIQTRFADLFSNVNCPVFYAMEIQNI